MQSKSVEHSFLTVPVNTYSCLRTEHTFCTSTSNPSVKALTKSAALCKAPTSVVSLQVYVNKNNRWK